LVIRLHLLLLCLLLSGITASKTSAQDQSPGPPANLGKITLNVVVSAKSGPPVAGLQQQDFTVLDNKAPQTITAFQSIEGPQAPIGVIIVIDSVNIGYESVARQRQEIDRFLRSDGGRLPFPTTIAVAADKGMEIQPDFSQDGNAIAAALDKSDIGLRDLGRSAGFWGADERLGISLRSIHELALTASARPGRKLVLWVSPGWPLLSGPGVEEQMTTKQEQDIFNQIVEFSTLLRQARVTLYSVDPLGTADVGMRTFYWQSFVKGVTKPSQALPGNLGLEVLAVQSGGLALSSSNDIAAQLQKCIADAGAYYEISYDQPHGDQPRQYHHIEIRLDKKGLTARSMQGYYALP
jgi:VWFA-related protein